jgi:hypothetical protein
MRVENMKTTALMPSIPPHHYTLIMLARKDDSLNTVGQIREKQCLVMINTRVLVTRARPDITAGLPESEMTTQHDLQLMSRDTNSSLKGVLVEVKLGRHPLTTWVFTAKITNKFILGLDVLQCPQCICGFGAPCAVTGR